MHILFLGDSLTYGYDVRYGLGWVELLMKHYPHCTFANAGLCGDTVQGMLYRYEERYSKLSFDILFIMGGTNDILMGRDAFYCFKKLESLVKLAQDKQQIVIGLAPAIDDDREGQNLEVLGLNQQLRSWAREEALPVIDFYDALEEGGKEALVFDGSVHPNAKGYAFMYERAKPVFDTLLSV